MLNIVLHEPEMPAKRQKTSWKLLDRVRNLSGLKIRILQSAENFQMMRYFTVRHWIKIQAVFWVMKNRLTAKSGLTEL